MKTESAVLPLDALSQLESAARALIEAVQMVRGGSVSSSQLPTLHAAHTVTDVANEFLLAKARAGRSPAYLAQCVKHLRSFDELHGTMHIQAVTAAHVERWLYGNAWAQRTRLGHLLTVRTFFTFAVQRLYISGNPALAVDRPAVEDEPPLIHTPEEVGQVLSTNLALDASAARCLAIRYFAGLRTSEAVSLAESEIHTERGFIEVTAAKAKTRKRRIVTVHPALASWLQATAAAGGRLPLPQANNRLSEAVKRAAVPWGKSVTRHTFCSYHLAEFGSASRTALEAGHTEQMLFQHYREIVTREQAAKFWSVKPLQN